MKKILICTDGSAHAEQACHYAAWLQKQTGAQIDVLYVTDLRQFQIPAVADFSGSLGIQPFEGMIDQLREVEEIKSVFIKEHALKILDEARVGESVTFYHETGLLVDVIRGHAENADMVLLGKRGENADFASEHLGSMLERVVRAATKPCLVTNRKFAPIHRMAIAFDGGASSRRALDLVKSIDFMKTIELHLIVCAEGRYEDEATTRLEEGEERLKQDGFSPKCQVLAGVVESAIADYVESESIDLLVLGAYGHSRIRELLIGSTTTELLRSCHVPVLCCR